MYNSMRLECLSCSHRWDYKGTGKRMYTSCPNCKHNVRIMMTARVITDQPQKEVAVLNIENKAEGSLLPHVPTIQETPTEPLRDETRGNPLLSDVLDSAKVEQKRIPMMSVVGYCSDCGNAVFEGDTIKCRSCGSIFE